MSENHIHTHVDENENTHTHSHQHPHEQTKAVLNRISRAQGHLEAVRKMIERGEDCAQVISALNSAGRVILKDHIAHCIVDAVEADDMEPIEALNQAIDRFMR